MTQPLSNHFTDLTPSWTDVPAQGRFNEITRRVGREEGAQVIDLVQHLVDEVPEWNQHMRLFYDGMHVNDHGSEVYATHIAEQLLPAIQAELNIAGDNSRMPIANKPTADSRR